MLLGTADPDGFTSTFTVTCNADGTGWVFEGQPITYVECFYIPGELTSAHIPPLSIRSGRYCTLMRN